MKLFWASLFVLSFVGCTKSNNNGVEPIDPNKQYTIKFDFNDQNVKTSVTNDTLHLDYYENLTFLVDPTEYSHTWALHLTEDFSKSNLSNLSYSCLSDGNVYAYDFRSENLNHVHPSQKSISDATVNGKKYIKVQLQRTIMFFKVYANQQAAIDAQNTVLQAKTDVVNFASFYNYDGVSSMPNTATAKLVYTK